MFEDTASGAAQRPALREALPQLRAGDTLLVWQASTGLADRSRTPSRTLSPCARRGSRCAACLKEAI